MAPYLFFIFFLTYGKEFDIIATRRCDEGAGLTWGSQPVALFLSK